MGLVWLGTKQGHAYTCELKKKDSNPGRKRSADPNSRSISLSCERGEGFIWPCMGQAVVECAYRVVSSQPGISVLKSRSAAIGDRKTASVGQHCAYMHAGVRMYAWNNGVHRVPVLTAVFGQFASGLHESETIQYFCNIIVSHLEILENFSLVLVFSVNMKRIIALSWNSWSYWSYADVRQKASRLFKN